MYSDEQNLKQNVFSFYKECLVDRQLEANQTQHLNNSKNYLSKRDSKILSDIYCENIAATLKWHLISQI